MTVVGKSRTKPVVIPVTDVAPPVPPRPPRVPDDDEVPDAHPMLSRFPKEIGKSPLFFRLVDVQILEHFERRSSASADAIAAVGASLSALFTTGKQPTPKPTEVWWARTRLVTTEWQMTGDAAVWVESSEMIPDGLADDDAEGWAALMKVVIATAEDDALERVKALIDRGICAEADDAKAGGG